MSIKDKTKQKNIEELKAFYESLEGVIPLKNKKVRLPLVPAIDYYKMVEKPLFKEQIVNASEQLDLREVGSEDFISYKKTSLSNKIFNKLKNNQFSIDALLDLHGLTVDEAIMALNNFLYECINKKIQAALIIHGKGKKDNTPILKNKINHWLREINSILAFCSAMPKHGGNGAVYILLTQ